MFDSSLRRSSFRGWLAMPRSALRPIDGNSHTALFAMAFVSIGRTSLPSLVTTDGGRPAVAFLGAQAFNLLVTLAAAYVFLRRLPHSHRKATGKAEPHSVERIGPRIEYSVCAKHQRRLARRARAGTSRRPLPARAGQRLPLARQRAPRGSTGSFRRLGRPHDRECRGREAAETTSSDRRSPPILDTRPLITQRSAVPSGKRSWSLAVRLSSRMIGHPSASESWPSSA